MNDIPNRSKRKAYQKKAHSLIDKVTDQERLILLIRDSYRNNNLDDALSYARELVDKNPNSYEGYNRLGIVQSNRYELEDAIKSFEKAIEINPDDFTAYDFLMGHHIPSGDRVMLPEERRSVEKGLEYGDELIRIRPDSGFPYHFKANCYRQMGEFEKATPLYEQSIKKRRGKSSEGTALLVSGHNYMFGGTIIKQEKDIRRRLQRQKRNKDGIISIVILHGPMFLNQIIMVQLKTLKKIVVN